MINGKKIVALCTYRIHEAQEFSFVSELGKLLKKNDCYLFIYALNSEIGITNDTSPEAVSGVSRPTSGFRFPPRIPVRVQDADSTWHEAYA